MWGFWWYDDKLIVGMIKWKRESGKDKEKGVGHKIWDSKIGLHSISGRLKSQTSAWSLKSYVLPPSLYLYLLPSFTWSYLLWACHHATRTLTIQAGSHSSYLCPTPGPALQHVIEGKVMKRRGKRTALRKNWKLTPICEVWCDYLQSTGSSRVWHGLILARVQWYRVSILESYPERRRA